MAVVKFTNSKSGLKKIIDYVAQKEKTEARLLSGQACMPESAYDEKLLIKQMFGKNHGRQYIHIVQSFSPTEEIGYKTAHEIAQKLAARFEGFQALVATHKDRDHIHSHIVLNSVNYETGLKFQQSKNDMQAVKDYSDEICLSYGLSVIEKKEKMINTYISREVYQAAIKGESWKFELINAIDEALNNVRNKEVFISKMADMGYGVCWEEKRKHITFTTPEGKKCRSNRLYDEKYTKEGLTYELERRARSEQSHGNVERKTENEPSQAEEIKHKSTGNSEPNPNLSSSQYYNEPGMGRDTGVFSHINREHKAALARNQQSNRTTQRSGSRERKDQSDFER